MARRPQGLDLSHYVCPVVWGKSQIFPSPSSPPQEEGMVTPTNEIPGVPGFWASTLFMNCFAGAGGPSLLPLILSPSLQRLVQWQVHLERGSREGAAGNALPNEAASRAGADNPEKALQPGRLETEIFAPSLRTGAAAQEGKMET